MGQSGVSFVISLSPLQWCQAGVMMSQITDHSSVNILFALTSNKHWRSKLLALCEGNLPQTGRFHSQMANNAENVPISWRFHVKKCAVYNCVISGMSGLHQRVSCDGSSVRLWCPDGHGIFIQYAMWGRTSAWKCPQDPPTMVTTS